MKFLSIELEKVRALVGTLPRRRILPPTSARPTWQALQHVQAKWDTTSIPPEDRVEQVKRAVITAQKSDGGLSQLHPRLMKDAVWLLWPTTSDGINRPALRRAVLERVENSNALLKRLIDAWFLNFDSSDVSFAEVGRQIDHHLEIRNAGLLATWKEANKNFDLFNSSVGPGRIADRILEEDSSNVLSVCRLDTPVRATSGYLKAVHHALSSRLPKLLVTDQSVDIFGRAKAFFVPGPHLRFDTPETDGGMADGLVGPWLRAGRQPSENLKSEVLTFLREHLGDPRVDEKRRWANSSEGTRQRVRAWLSKLSLDAFFDVVGRFAGDAGMGHQWKARKAFWRMCLEKGHIEDSWLVLGDSVVRAISDNVELRGSYGRLLDGDPRHSVLLMRIGNLVLSEWTYNGKLRAWPEDWKNSPRLFRSRYRRSQVTGSGLEFPAPADRPDLSRTTPDGVSHTVVWQGRVAALLQKKEGIVLQPNDWRVR